MLKVASWNVNSVKARGERLVAFLKRESPDILCLQELKVVDEAFPLEAVREQGYHSAIFGQKTYNGVAILAKTEPHVITRGFDDGVDDPAARFLLAEVGGVKVASVYVPNGQSVGSDKYEYKLKWLARLEKFLKKRHAAKESLLLAGDFNVAPEDRDVHDPEAWRGQVLVSDPERAGLQAVQESSGLVDTFRLHHDEGGKFSWWDYRQLGFPRNAGLRIDLILATGPMAKRCQATRIDRDERKGKLPSDHAPVIAEFA